MRRCLLSAVLGLVVAACSSSSSAPSSPVDAGSDAKSTHDASDASDAASCASPPCAITKIEHLVVIVQENHTFDTYFGRWCTAAPGSAPSCTQGPSCCEAGPATVPGSPSSTPEALDDTANAAYDPDHLQVCELAEIDGGKMDGYLTAPSITADSGTVSTCGTPQNFAYADSAVQTYWNLAQKGAIADRYFQPVAGQSSSNDMYFARARFVFRDNTYEPLAIGDKCGTNYNTIQYTDETVADLLEHAGVNWAWYSDGYAVMQAAVAKGGCPTKAPADCALGLTFTDCSYDPSDNPFAYYKGLVDDPKHFKDYAQLATDISGGVLPPVVFIKALDYKTEHPGYGNLISAGVTFVTNTLSAIQSSPYGANTLVLLTWDEGGGFFDHVSPPPQSTVDGEPYGTRVPLLAIGPFARVGAVSHATMEHSSIVKFIEYNWLDAKTGQLGGRDAVVANIGSVLEASLGVPED
jgi:phospholipase C